MKVEISRQALGLRIRSLRKDMGMRQEELAEKVGYSGKAMISSIERGTTGIEPSKLAKIAEVLGTTPAELCDGSQYQTTDSVADLLEPDVEEPKEGVPAQIWAYAIAMSELNKSNQQKVFSLIDYLKNEE